MTYEEVVTQLRAKGKKKELDDIRALIGSETVGMRGARQSITRTHLEVQIAQAVTLCLEGSEPQSPLVQRVAEALNTTAPKRHVRGSKRPDLGPSLSKLEAFLQREGGVVRILSDRNSFMVVYRDVGVSSDSLGGALADLIGKMERVESK